mmetsp:Transcript_74/g.331  ORF Transcript_74/g.331 Transcript_74/m.331 type:complete len:105 (+) Transcript_74:3146-3460(+)
MEHSPTGALFGARYGCRVVDSVLSNSRKNLEVNQERNSLMLFLVAKAAKVKSRPKETSKFQAGGILTLSSDTMGGAAEGVEEGGRLVDAGRPTPAVFFSAANTA